MKYAIAKGPSVSDENVQQIEQEKPSLDTSLSTDEVMERTSRELLNTYRIEEWSGISSNPRR